VSFSKNLRNIKLTISSEIWWETYFTLLRLLYLRAVVVFLVNLFKVNIMPKQKISLREKILQWTSKKDLYEIKSTREMFCKACGKLVS
jgi:ABC-type transport system involved in cytochrome bd biosynthesis fused ATPase/permease subunit